MCSTICVEWAFIILVLVWLNRSIFEEHHARKTIFTFLFPNLIALDLWPLDRKFPPLATLAQCYLFPPNLEVSTAFLFRENQRHMTDGHTDGGTNGVPHLMRPPREGRIITAGSSSPGHRRSQGGAVGAPAPPSRSGAQQPKNSKELNRAYAVWYRV